MSQKILRTMQDDLKEISETKKRKGLFRKSEPAEKDAAALQPQPQNVNASITAPKTKTPAQAIPAKTEKENFSDIKSNLEKKGFNVSMPPRPLDNKKTEAEKGFFAKLQQSLIRRKKVPPILRASKPEEEELDKKIEEKKKEIETLSTEEKPVVAAQPQKVTDVFHTESLKKDEEGFDTSAARREFLENLKRAEIKKAAQDLTNAKEESRAELIKKEEAARKAEEERMRQEEEAARKAEEEVKKAEEEAARKAEEERMRQEEEELKRQEEAKKAEEERRREKEATKRLQEEMRLRQEMEDQIKMEEAKKNILEEVRKERDKIKEDILAQIKKQEESRLQEIQRAEEELRRQELLREQEERKAKEMLKAQEIKISNILREVSSSLSNGEAQSEKEKKALVEEIRAKLLEEAEKNKQDILAQIRKQEEERNKELNKAKEELKKQEALRAQEAKLAQQALRQENERREKESLRLKQSIEVQQAAIADLIRRTANPLKKEELLEEIRTKILEEEKKNNDAILEQIKQQEVQLTKLMNEISESLRKEEAIQKKKIEEEIIAKIKLEDEKTRQDLYSQFSMQTAQKEADIKKLQKTIQEKDAQISNLVKGIAESLQEEEEKGEAKEKLIEEMRLKIAALEEEKKQYQKELSQMENDVKKQIEEAARKAAEEERMRQEEARKNAEMERLKREKERLQQEEARLRQEAGLEPVPESENTEIPETQQRENTQEDELKQEEEAARKAEEERMRQEEAKKAEEEAKKAEEERMRQEEEAARKAEEERMRQEEAKKAEEEAKKAEEERMRQEEEAARKAEEERMRQEEAKKAEEEAKKAEEIETDKTETSTESAPQPEKKEETDSSEAFWNALRQSRNKKTDISGSAASTKDNNPIQDDLAQNTAPSQPAPLPKQTATETPKASAQDEDIKDLIKRVSRSMETSGTPNTTVQEKPENTTKPDKDRELKDLLSRMSQTIKKEKTTPTPKPVAEEAEETDEEPTDEEPIRDVIHGPQPEEYLKKNLKTGLAASNISYDRVRIPGTDNNDKNYWEKIHNTIKEPAISPQQRLMGGTNNAPSPYDVGEPKIAPLNQNNLAMSEEVKTAQQRIMERRQMRTSYTSPENRLIHGGQEFYSTMHKTIKPAMRPASLEGLEDILNAEPIEISEEEEKKRLKQSIISKYGIKLFKFPWLRVILISIIFLSIIGGTLIIVLPKLNQVSTKELEPVIVGESIAEIDRLISAEAFAKESEVTTLNYFDANVKPWKSFDNGEIIRLNINYNDQEILASREKALKAILGESNASNIPDNFMDIISPEYNILVFKENNTLRLALVFKYDRSKEEELKDAMSSWETTNTKSKKIYSVMKNLFVNSRIVEGDNPAFQPAMYNGTELRFVNLPDSDTSMDYFLYEGFVAFTSSKDHAFQLIDLLKK
jgi:hypothetical protein